MPLPVPDRLVVLTFDDSVSNHATFVGPLLKELGFGATFYVTEFVGDGNDRFDLDKRQYMTWEQIAGLDRAGFEIGNHTGTHRSVQGLPAAELAAEIDLIETRCAAHGIPRPTTFCYPGGGEAPTALPVLREKGYALARGVGERAYAPGIDDPLSVPSFVITGEREALFERALSEARDGRIAVLTYHGSPDHNHPWVDTPPALFEKMMRRLAAENATVIAMRDLSRYAA